MDAVGERIKKEIFEKVSEYYRAVHEAKQFVPGETGINYAGRVFDDQELQLLVDSALDFWLTYGVYSERFERELSRFLGIKYCSIVNSGSSANFLAIMAITSHKLKDRRLNNGDEVITIAAAFPTTVAPIIQCGAIPVFVDVTIPTYNIDCRMLEEALSPKTKGVFLAHTLGNPYDIDAVKAFCDKNGLWMIEDNCDALGSTYGGRYTGTFGDLATGSFYPAHHITTGEGGAVFTNSLKLRRVVESFRDWGRDCWCHPGNDNTCDHRFSRQFGELPFGYDHKYVYSHFGYNLKATDLQAAIGCAQIKKVKDFLHARRRNFRALYECFKPFEESLVLPEPTEKSDPSWFGFPLTIREGAGFMRQEIVSHLERNKIQTRTLFAGNIVKHPCFDSMRKGNKGFRVVGSLKNTDLIMNNTFWIGVYPGLTDDMLNYVADQVKVFFASLSSPNR